MHLVFVYNANAGKVNSIIDSVHKIVSPSTYNCALCALTYGTFKENTAWKNFKEHSGIKMDFYHKNEFQNLFESISLPQFEFPIILSAENDTLEIFMTAEELKKIENTESLISEVKRRQIHY